MRTRAHTHTHISVRVCAHTHARTHAHTHTRTHAHTHTHKQGYVAPEIIKEKDGYGLAVDMWSMGGFSIFFCFVCAKKSGL